MVCQILLNAFQLYQYLENDCFCQTYSSEFSFEKGTNRELFQKCNACQIIFWKEQRRNIEVPLIVNMNLA